MKGPSSERIALVTFFALREIVQDLAEAKGEDAAQWKASLSSRIAHQMSLFITPDGKSVDMSKHPEVQSIIRTLLAERKAH